jgi:negative regulator of sigma E activity
VSYYLFFGSLALLSVPAFASETSQSEPVGTVRLVSQVNEAETRRESDIHKLVSTRRYVMRNKRWEKDAVMDVRMTYESGIGKKFEILAMDNAGGLQKRAFEKILESEVEASKKSLEIEDGAITPANYEFTPMGTEIVNGRQCLILQLKPKRKSKYLLDGKAWIDEKEQAIVRVEGRTAHSVSFWIGKPYIAQTFRKVDDVWVSASNRSVSDVKLLGRTELSIDFTEYQIIRGDRELARTRHLD